MMYSWWRYSCTETEPNCCVKLCAGTPCISETSSYCRTPQCRLHGHLHGICTTKLTLPFVWQAWAVHLRLCARCGRPWVAPLHHHQRTRQLIRECPYPGGRWLDHGSLDSPARAHPWGECPEARWCRLLRCLEVGGWELWFRPVTWM